MLTQTGKLSPRRGLWKRLAVLTTAGAFGVATLTAAPGHARADAANPAPGITGGAFLGAEVVTIGMSLFGVRSGWAYLAGAVVGAGGGAAGGWAVENASTDDHPGVYMLAGGFALMIPAVVLSLNATRYRPAENASDDRAPTNTPAPDPGRAGGNSAAPQPPATPPPAPASGQPTTGPGSTGGTSSPAGPQSQLVAPPTSLVDVYTGSVRLGVPVPEVRPVYTAQQLKESGVQQATEYRLPVVKVVF